MLIQLENLTAVNPDRVILTPAGRDTDGSVRSFDVLTEGFQRIATITPREAEVFLFLASRGQELLSEHPVLRTREWSVIDGSLNYRRASLLTEQVREAGFVSIEDYLKFRAKDALPDGRGENRFDVLHLVEDLTRDREYIFNDAAKLKDILRSYSMNAAQKLQAILDAWDDIFIDLPF